MKTKPTKTSLVLSGGGALGLAHIGVIKNLEQNQKIQITEIIGTSMGSLIGALLATNYTSTQMEEILKEINYLNLFQPSILSKNSLIRTEKIYKFLEEKLGNITFENLKINLKIVATNLKNGKKTTFDKTNTPKIKIIQGICASICVPAIFSPYKINKKEYIDGGLCSNLPIELAKNKNIIASNVITQKYVENLKSNNSINILEKSSNIFILNQTKEKIKNLSKTKNLKLMETNLINIKPYEFNKSKKIIEIGKKQNKF